MESSVRYAVSPSRRRDAHKQSGPMVGYDVFEITGHTQVGEQVFLTLKPTGWVRHLESLTTMAKDTA